MSMVKNRFLALVLTVIGCCMAVNAAERMKMSTTVPPAKIPGVPVMENPLYDPEGTNESYIMNVTENTYFGNEDVDGYKMTIRRSADGKKIYFQDLTPGFNGDANTEGYSWVMGNVDGNVITIPAGQVLYKTAEQVLYLEVVSFDENGQVKDFLNDVTFTINGDVISQTNNDVRIAVFDNTETMDEAGFFIFMNNFVIQPISDIFTFTVPADAEVEEWMLTSSSDSRLVKVARSGNDVYIAGLSSMAPDDYVMGTIANGKLTFRSGYILTSAATKYIRLIGAREGEPDEFGMPQLEMTATYEFDVNDAEDHFTLNPAGDYIVEASYFNFNMLNGISNVEIFRYGGDVPATPATPEIISWSEADGLLQFTIPCSDIDGNYINPAHITYRIYLDGELHTFSPDNYYAIPSEMTDIPYDFTDYYDIYTNNETKTIFLHAQAFATVEIESIYTVDGDARVSGRALYSGIDSVTNNVSPVVSETYTDILGRRVSSPAPGSFIIKTSVHSDGTRTVSKHIVR